MGATGFRLLAAVLGLAALGGCDDGAAPEIRGAGGGDALSLVLGGVGRAGAYAFGPLACRQQPAGHCRVGNFAAGRDGAPARRDPILFVHGWQGDAAQWRTMRARFRADGWTDRELFAWNLHPGATNAANAARIAARVDQILVATGATRVDVVAHSMGSLASRHYLRGPHAAGKVDAWVSLGGPNHGTLTAELCPAAACREMRRGSPFLLALNRGDETPGPTRYATWASPCDEVVDPPESVALEGAANHRTGCLSHMALVSDSTVYAAVRDFVAAPPGASIPAPAPPTPLCDCAPRHINVCVVERGQLREVRADYQATTGDTLVDGRPFSRVYPLTAEYGARAAWFVQRQPITWEGRRYVPSGLPRVMGIDQVVRVGEYRGVSLFARPEAGRGPPDVVYVPMRTGCEFLPYRYEADSSAQVGPPPLPRSAIRVDSPARPHATPTPSP